MQDAGVQIERYHALRWYSLGRLNNRTHRKILLIDGNIGFHRRGGHRGSSGQAMGRIPITGAICIRSA